VIIPTRDQPLLKDVVDLVAEQSYPDELVEILVVDDGSERPLDVADLGARARKRTRVVHHESPGFGAGAARSHGAALARNDVLAFLDSDVRVPHHYLESHARWHHVAENALVVGQMRMLDRLDVSPKQLRRDSSIGWERVQWVANYLDRTDGLLIDHPDVWSVATGASVSVRRTFHDRFGGFAGFGIRGIEDIEFGYRAYAYGGLVVPEHQGYGWHPPERFFSDPARAKAAKLRRSELLADRVPTPKTRVEGSQRIRSVPSVVVNVRIPPLEEMNTTLLLAALDRWLVTTHPTMELILHGVARRSDRDVVADAVCADPRIRSVEQRREESSLAARVAFCELHNLRLAQSLVRRLDETQGLVGVRHSDRAPTVAIQGRALNRALLATGHSGDAWPEAAALRFVHDFFGSIWEDDTPPPDASVGGRSASEMGSPEEGVGSDADLLEQMAHLRAELHRVEAQNRRLRSRLVVLGLSGFRDERGGDGL
jgi:glycosyltransferase involved in cell wall biosynthesis